MAQPPPPPGFIPLNSDPSQGQPPPPPGFVPMEQAQEKPWVGDPRDAAMAFARGVPSGLAQMVALPYRALDWAAEKITGTGGLPDVDQMSAWAPLLNPERPQTRLGDFVQSGAQAVGGSILPVGATLALAGRSAAAPAATTLGQIGQNIVQSARANPGQFVAMDAASAASGGVAQQAAADAGYGPAVQTLAGMVGGMAPGVASAYRAPSGQPVGSPTAQGIARQRYDNAVLDEQAFTNQQVRPFGPSFNQGPVASFGKQMTETPFVGAPLRNNLDETITDTAGAVRRVADAMSPNATLEQAGGTMQRGLDRYRVQGFDELEPGIVRGLGINPVQPVPVPQGGGQAQLQRINAAQPGIQQITGGSVQSSRGTPAPLPQTRAQSRTARTGVEDLSNQDLMRVIRAPSDQTSFTARQEALYERAFRNIPPLLRANGSRDPMLLPTANSAQVVRGIIANEDTTGIRSGLQGRYGQIFETLGNPRANVPLTTLRQMRTAIGRDLGNFGMYDASLDRTQLRQIYAGLSSDIEVGLQDIASRAVASARQGGNLGLTRNQATRAVQALRDFQVADRYTRQGMERMDRFLQAVRAENPQAVAAQMVRAATDGTRGNMRMFRSAMSVLRPEERAQFGALIVRELGAPTPSARGIVQEAQFSPSRFVTNYTALSPDARAMLFGPEHQRALDDLFRVANRIANVEALANTSRSGTNAMNMTGIAASIGSLASGNVATPLMIGGGGYASSVLMSLPQYTQWMTRYLRLRAAISDGSSRSMAPLVRHITGLERNARYNPELWPVYAVIAQENGILDENRGN
jgi:hypothetical protein